MVSLYMCTWICMHACEYVCLCMSLFFAIILPCVCGVRARNTQTHKHNHSNLQTCLQWCTGTRIHNTHVHINTCRTAQRRPFNDQHTREQSIPCIRTRHPPGAFARLCIEHEQLNLPKFSKVPEENDGMRRHAAADAPRVPCI
jgi:hypothetical protein